MPTPNINCKLIFGSAISGVFFFVTELSKNSSLMILIPYL